MDPSQLQEFGRRLARQRKLLGLSKLKLQEKSGVDRTTIHRLESGVQNPEDLTLKKLATALETTVLGLVGAPSVQPTDPKLEHLTEEDLDVAQAFHHAPLYLKQRALGVLQERSRREALTEPVSDWAKRLLALPERHRAMVAQLIEEMSQPTGTTTSADSASLQAPVGDLSDSAVDQMLFEIMEELKPLGLESLAAIRGLIPLYRKAESRGARALKTQQQHHLRTARKRRRPPSYNG